VTYNKNTLLIAGIIFLVLFLLPIFITSDYFINVLILIFLFIMIGQSWNLLGGYTGLINIGQSAFFGIGALFARLMWVQGIPIYIFIVIGGLASIVLACIIGIPALRLRGIYFPIGTLGLGVMIRVIVTAIYPGLAKLPAGALSNWDLTPRYYVALVVMGLIVAAMYIITKSKLGLAFLSIREDQDAAEATGVNTLKYKIYSLCISTFMAGAAGGVFAFYYASYLYSDPFLSLYALQPLLITFIGGVGTILGPVIGAIFFKILNEVFSTYLGQVSVLLFGVLLILVVLFLPGGLVDIGNKIRNLFRSRSTSKAT
jgi:branched-chain amino acid transport system permease protein